MLALLKSTIFVIFDTIVYELSILNPERSMAGNITSDISVDKFLLSTVKLARLSPELSVNVNEIFLIELLVTLLKLVIGIPPFGPMLLMVWALFQNL